MTIVNIYLSFFLAQILQAQARAIELSELEKENRRHFARELVYEEKCVCVQNVKNDIKVGEKKILLWSESNKFKKK